MRTRRWLWFVGVCVEVDELACVVGVCVEVDEATP